VQSEAIPPSPETAGPPGIRYEDLYTPPRGAPERDLKWQETCANVQSMQFMIDCLPAINRLLAGFPAGKPIRVLDVGTGSGAGANLLATLYAGDFLGRAMMVDAIDLARRLERYAKAKFPTIHYTVGNVLDLRPEPPWDLVLCSHTIEHIKDYVNFVRHLQTLATKWVLFYAPWKEKDLIAAHVVSIDEEVLAAARAVGFEIIDSPGWRPAGKDPRCVLFLVRGTACDAADDHIGPAVQAVCEA
jgi:SAM-dependent methyltransferase